MGRLEQKKEKFIRRKLRIKGSLTTTDPSKLRLCLTRSNKSFYAQVIDDSKGNTVIGVSSLSKEFSSLKSKSNKDAAKLLGQLIATKALEKGVKNVYFDRNGLLYHGRVKIFADSARENGLVF